VLDHTGSAPLFVHVAAVLPVVATCVVGRLVAPDCHVVPVQKKLSEDRCNVNVVVFGLRPEPLVLSAALPEKFAGTVAVRNALPVAGVVTDALMGLVLSRVKVIAVPVKEFPALSVAFACTV